MMREDMEKPKGSRKRRGLEKPLEITAESQHAGGAIGGSGPVADGTELQKPKPAELTAERVEEIWGWQRHDRMVPMDIQVDTSLGNILCHFEPRDGKPGYRVTSKINIGIEIAAEGDNYVEALRNIRKALETKKVYITRHIVK